MGFAFFFFSWDLIESGFVVLEAEGLLVNNGFVGFYT